MSIDKTRSLVWNMYRLDMGILAQGEFDALQSLKEGKLFEMLHGKGNKVFKCHKDPSEPYFQAYAETPEGTILDYYHIDLWNKIKIPASIEAYDKDLTPKEAVDITIKLLRNG